MTTICRHLKWSCIIHRRLDSNIYWSFHLSVTTTCQDKYNCLISNCLTINLEWKLWFVHCNTLWTLIYRHFRTIISMLFITIPYTDFSFVVKHCNTINCNTWSLQADFANNRRIHPYNCILLFTAISRSIAIFLHINNSSNLKYTL